MTQSRRWSAAFATGGCALIGYTYLGYPTLVRWAAGRRPPVRRDDHTPRLTVVIPAHNEEKFIGEKLDDTFAQSYPDGLLEVIVVDDGSTDTTASVVRASPHPVTLIRQDRRGGKSQAINAGVAAASGEVVVFTDANAALGAGSLRAIASAFRDPAIGVVSGTKRPIGAGAHGHGEALYWQLESGLKDAEGRLGCTVGADGGIYAVRRSAFEPIPDDVVGDDFFLPIDALARGYSVGHEAHAWVSESVSKSPGDDFERRTRIAAGIWQVSLSHLRLASPRRGWVAVAFISHRLLRTMVVPMSLMPVLAASLRAGRSRPPVRLMAMVQVLVYAGAVAGLTTGSDVFGPTYQFGLTNAAAVRGGIRYLRRRQTPLWELTERGPWQPGARSVR